MDAWIIYTNECAKKNHHFIQMFFDEGKKKEIRFKLILLEYLQFGIKDNFLFIEYNSEPCPLPSFVVCRCAYPLLSAHLENMKIPVFNNSMVSDMCNNKLRTHEYLSPFGIRMADTIFSQNLFGSSLNNLKFPLVVKPASDHGGRNVSYVHNTKEYELAIDKIKSGDIVIQRPVSDLGKDLRVYVLGKDIITAILRTSTTDFRSNYSLGGLASIYILTSDEIQVVNKIISLFDFGLVGIDFVFHNGEIVFNEIEDVVGCRMLYSITNINIIEKYINHILQNI